MSGRPWFAMKPERMWTKQHEAFLYFDPALKPRAGQGPGFQREVAWRKRTDHEAFPSIFRTGFAAARGSSHASSGRRREVVHSENSTSFGQGKAVEGVPMAAESSVVEEAATTMAESSLEEVFTVRPMLFRTAGLV
ncbi:hypothetical protein A0H81_01418 [Grifola frondosa]|uniref:Uncharacterized protein n=1 Tax=Grifola frondosa TaxID=5627 RepID=A0A1C7MU72_GRIFR|nr:hypothetical protein A0H81_01418 [Grifola frondosa]